jgi:hypothetical protein
VNIDEILASLRGSPLFKQILDPPMRRVTN